MSKLGTFNFILAQGLWLRWAKCNDGTWGIVFPVVLLMSWVSRYVPRHYRLLVNFNQGLRSSRTNGFV